MTSVFSVVLLVAGGRSVGLGHLRRCVTLAARLGIDQMHIRFVTVSREAGAFLSDSGVPVVVSCQEEALLQTISLLKEVPPPVVCVVDDPDFPSDSFRALRRYAPVLCIDDTCERALPVDLVVNGSAGAEDLPYRGAADTRYLLGPRYILLRESFAREPERPTEAGPVWRVLVLSGGGETGLWSGRIVALIAETLPEVCADIVVGPFGTPPVLAEALSHRVVVHETPEDLRALMLSADLAVTGGGQTAYELAATATPALGVRLADNQTINLRGLERAGALRDLGSPDGIGFPDRFRGVLRDLAHDSSGRRTMGTRGRHLVDGRGVERVAEWIAVLARGAKLPEEDGMHAQPCRPTGLLNGT